MHRYYFTGEVWPGPYWTSGDWLEFWSDAFRLSHDRISESFVDTKNPLPDDADLWLLHYYCDTNNLIVCQKELLKPKKEAKFVQFASNVYINKQEFWKNERHYNQRSIREHQA